MAKKKSTTSKAKKGKKKSASSTKDVHLQAALDYLEKWSREGNGAPVVDFHCHTTCSDGLLTPQQLVERAHRRGVKVLAVTDHDTMSGVPAAIVAARSYGIRIIPGVEISTRFVNSCGKMGELVHILAYYGCCGPSEGLEEKLTEIREGRYLRARNMVQKLKELKKPLNWDKVLKIAGPGVAPGRPHVARALVQAGHVSTVGEAFSKYLFDDGPAYSTGAELPAAEAVRLIINTGGIAVLAHPWSLKNPMGVIEQLKSAGLHAMEVYKSSGSDKGFASLADMYKLVKLGGSDYHGTGAVDETDLGKVEIPPKALHELLKIADPIWLDSLNKVLSSFAQGNLQRPFKKEISQGEELEFICGDVQLVCDEKNNVTSLRLSRWLSDQKRQMVVECAGFLGLTYCIEEREDFTILIVSKASSLT